MSNELRHLCSTEEDQEGEREKEAEEAKKSMKIKQNQTSKH